MDGDSQLALHSGSKEYSVVQEICEPLKVACGGAHTLFISSDAETQDDTRQARGELWGWGSNSYGQQGVAPKEGTGATKHEFAKQVEFFKKDDILEVACGKNHSVVLEAEGQEPDGSVTASRVWSFGLGANGRLGTGVDVEEAQDPQEVTFPTPQGAGVLSNTKVVVQRVCCGSDHSLALVNFTGMGGTSTLVGGRLFAWGLGNYGALGTKNRRSETTPVEVWFPEDTYRKNPDECFRVQNIVMVTAGVKHSVAITRHGKIYTWGHGGYGRLGHGKASARMHDASFAAEFEPREVKAEALEHVRIRWVAAGESHTAAVDMLGGMYTWGQGSMGRCGHGFGLDVGTPMRVEALTGVGVHKVDCGLMHTVATTVKGQLWAWGKGPPTGLGIGDAVRELPAEIDLPDINLDLTPVYQVACGPLHTVVVMLDGVIFYFGAATEGRMVRVGVDLPRDVIAPRKLDEKGWNEARNRQLHDRALKDQDKTGEADYRQPWWPEQIACGGCHSASVSCSGDLWLWGSKSLTSSCEQKEEDTQVTASVDDSTWRPSLQKKGLSEKVSLISIGQEHCLAILGGQGRKSGPLYAWGSGLKGQLGTGSLDEFQPYPMQVSNVKVVIHAAAGEAHSACVGEGGELFTWGEALGGRLGLGSTQSEGLEMLPKQARITGVTSPDVRLKYVACGSQHTAFISEDFWLLTCGNGWYGRLGRGDTQNAYDPKPVMFIDKKEPKISDVQCAQYHTCIRDYDNILWITGRDQCVCKAAGQHILTAEPFEPFWNGGVEPKRVKLVAAAEQHTLAVTDNEELWVWGQNNRGQLGLLPAVASIINPPWLLQLKGLRKHDRITKVVTANAHSMVLVKYMKKKKKSQRKAGNQKMVPEHVEKEAPPPNVYAWGYAASGRLGVRLDNEEDNVELLRYKDPASRARSLEEYKLPPTLRTYEQRLVIEEWKVDDGGQVQKGSAIQDLDKSQFSDFLTSGPSIHWYDIQRKLHAEPQDQKKAKLKEQEAEVDRSYRNFMFKVLDLWKKPTDKSAEKVEWHLRKKEREIEIEYIRNLRVLDLGNSVNAPRLEGRLHTPKKIQLKICYFEELVWVLQQQPLYLANLAKRLVKKRNDEDETTLFKTVIAQMFEEMSNKRCLNLYKALLRVLIKFEIEKAIESKDLFHPQTSRVIPLVMHLSTNAEFFRKIALPILDPDDERSLVHNVIKYSLSKDWETLRDQRLYVNGLFATTQAEYDEKLKEHRQERGFPPEEEGSESELQKQQRQLFQDDLKDEADFFCVRGVNFVPRLRNIQRIDGFLKYFIEEKLADQECEDIQMLLVFMAKHLYGRPSSTMHLKRGSSHDETSLPPEFFEPIAAVVLAGIISGVLKAFQTDLFALIRMRIKFKVQSMENQMLEKTKELKKQNKWNKDTLKDTLLQERVTWNIQALANFFERAAYQRKEHFEERDAGDMAASLRGLTCESLQKKLGSVLTEGIFKSRGEDSKGAFASDTTETQLTVNLYHSHYSLAQERVCMKESDLLLLTNMLYKYMEPDPHDTETTPLRIDKAASDRLAQLVTEIVPLQDNGKKEWSTEDIMLSQKHGYYHNFLMRSRYLEFRREGIHQPTFCQESQAPIPRTLAVDEQKKNDAVRAVKPFRNGDRGPPMDMQGASEHQYPFEFLEELMQDLSGSAGGENSSAQVRHPIYGKTFGDLKQHLEEIQDAIASSIEEGHEKATGNVMLQRITTGIQMVERIKESQDEKELREFVEKAMQRRLEYHSYLKSIKEGIKDIHDYQNAYNKKLQHTVEYLTFVHKVSKDCDIPEDIQAMAQAHSAMLTFWRAKRRKVRTKKHETPAQKVLKEVSRQLVAKEQDDDPAEMVGSPACTFDLKTLVSKGVVTRLNEKITHSVQKKMVFNFRYEEEDYHVQVFMRPATLLRSFRITREDMKLMGAGLKTAVKSYGDDFLWLNCFRLRRFLGQIAADTEL